MPTREIIIRWVDTEWQNANPDWKDSQHKGERQMLYDLIDEGEELDFIIGGMFGPDLQQAKVGRSLRRGVVVASDRRIIMLDKGVFGSSEVAEMPYDSVSAVTHSHGLFAGGLRIVGRGGTNFRIESIRPKEDAREFADCVRSHLQASSPRTSTTVPTQQSETAASTPSVVSAADELEKLAGLLERGLLSREEFDAMKRNLLGI